MALQVGVRIRQFNYTTRLTLTGWPLPPSLELTEVDLGKLGTNIRFSTSPCAKE